MGLRYLEMDSLELAFLSSTLGEKNKDRAHDLKSAGQ